MEGLSSMSEVTQLIDGRKLGFQASSLVLISNSFFTAIL